MKKNKATAWPMAGLAGGSVKVEAGDERLWIELISMGRVVHSVAESSEQAKCKPYPIKA